MYPILDFDLESKPIIEPSMFLEVINGAEYCVMCFFGEVIRKVVAEYSASIIAQLTCEMGTFPVYQIEYKGKKVALFQASVGAPLSAGQLHELTALGYSKVVACGGAGVLDSSLNVGKVIIPATAVRDEGTSYHYIAPSPEITLSEKSVSILEETLKAHNVSYVIGKTWTTDAFYRETEKRRDLRKSQNCITVDMECSAFIAVAQYTGISFGQYLYAGDCIGEIEWDHRDWETHSIREHLFWLSVEACLAL